MCLCVPLCRDEEIIMPDEHGGVVRENYLWKVSDIWDRYTQGCGVGGLG